MTGVHVHERKLVEERKLALGERELVIRIETELRVDFIGSIFWVSGRKQPGAVVVKDGASVLTLTMDGAARRV